MANSGILVRIEQIIVAGLLLGAVGVMFSGIILRYVVLPVATALGLESISFFWVEETGELLLCWLSMVGGAVGVLRRSHFFLPFLVHTLPPRAQKGIHIFNMVIVAAFGGVVAWQGWHLVELNSMLESPSLGISLGWGYAAAVVGGILTILYATAEAFSSPPVGHDIPYSDQD